MLSECLDFLIPLTENHLRIVLKNGQTHYNQGRPHSSIGPGIPDPPADLPVTLQEHRHRDYLSISTPGVYFSWGLLFVSFTRM